MALPRRGAAGRTAVTTGRCPRRRRMRRPGGGVPPLIRQMALWRRHDVVCAGVLLAPREQDADVPGRTDWAALEAAWTGLCAGIPHLLGEARVLMAVLRAPRGPGATRALRRAVPPPAPPGWWTRRDTVAPGFALWEASPSGDDGRPLRRLVVTCPPRHQARLSRWTWRGAGRAMPALATYLLHLAKVRYQYRVHAGELGFLARGDALETDVARLVALHEDDEAVTPERWRRAHQDLERVRVAAMDLALTAVGLAEMARTVEIAQDNARAVLPHAAFSPAGGPLADDEDMIGWFRAQLEDDRVYVEAAVQRAGGMEKVTEARIQRWFQDREERARRHSDRLALLQTSILGALLMGLGAIQAFEYRVPVAARLYAPLIALLSALALTLPTVVIRLSAHSPDGRSIGVSGYLGTAAVGASLGWLAVSLASYTLRWPVPEPAVTVPLAAAGAALTTAAAAIRSWFLRRQAEGGEARDLQVVPVVHDAQHVAERVGHGGGDEAGAAFGER
ncbi:CATRA conflict system CASPASE/TPR repeat-associated protein [Thermocatellispora tengchongensis]|uniref:CATRA conflict system CASPASE/TPR repeat-associated protein n=1 Tax=Thermocatellispora tengchongensis TaxID=1073253 RepID=UPI0036414C82